LNCVQLSLDWDETLRPLAVKNLSARNREMGAFHWRSRPAPDAQQARTLMKTFRNAFLFEYEGMEGNFHQT
jgi:hypothetical protein